MQLKSVNFVFRRKINFFLYILKTSVKTSTFIVKRKNEKKFNRFQIVLFIERLSRLLVGGKYFPIVLGHLSDNAIVRKKSSTT